MIHTMRTNVIRTAMVRHAGATMSKSLDKGGTRIWYAFAKADEPWRVAQHNHVLAVAISG
jgi:hypothetical protein